MLAPAWSQVKVGPLLRRESDLRTYHNLFKDDDKSISGLRKLGVRLAFARQEEPGILEAQLTPSRGKRTLVTFDGWRDYFSRLNGWDEWLHRELRSITRTLWIEEADSLPNVPIAINVRCGDFAVPTSPEDLYKSGNVRTPISWFVRSLTVMRQAGKEDWKAYVVSDGTDEELGPLLACHNVVRVRPGSAISGLLFLARGRTLIGAGGSTYSAWASFLGQMPTITHPGQPLTWFKIKNRRGQYIGEFDPDNPNGAFLEQAASVLRAHVQAEPA